MQFSTKKKIVKSLTLAGCFSTGILYASIGVIAILSFLQLKQGGADESAFFELLNGFLAGRILIWIIILGAVCFITWRFFEAIKDPYEVGHDTNGILMRIGGGFSSIADAMIAFSALQTLFSQTKASATGAPVQEREMVAGLLHTGWGYYAILAGGGLLLLTAVVLVFYGFSSRFTERIRAEDFSTPQRFFTHGMAYVGYFSRGVILGIIGFFYMKAAIEKDSRHVVNTDKAFDFIGDHIGHAWFILVAAGTICYGLYMFVLGLNYDTDIDRKR